MRAFRAFLAAVLLAAATGCSQIREVPKADAMRAGEVKDATVRTRTGEVYFFEKARVDTDSLSGLAVERRSVFLPGGEVQEVTEEREVYLALADIEQLSVRKRDWKHVGLWALGIGGAAAVIGFAAAQNAGDTGGEGGGYAPPPKPPDL